MYWELALDIGFFIVFAGLDIIAYMCVKRILKIVSGSLGYKIQGIKFVEIKTRGKRK